MKRLLPALVLVAMLSLSAFAGDIPGSGRQDPPAEPSPSPTAVTATTTSDTDTSLGSVLVTIYLTIIGA